MLSSRADRGMIDEQEQASEWQEAQRFAISVDLVQAALRQLEFLSSVDRHRWLYEQPERAIYRYKTCWLPLLAQHCQTAIVDGFLVVPLDCEWIWHCHRLNPVQYKKDCVEFYGRLLDNKNVESSFRASSKQETVDIWTKLYPEEPFELEYTGLANNPADFIPETKDIKYDLVAAVKRQSTFCYQVSRPVMHDLQFLNEALSRYKGFLHLIRRNRERSLKRFCVPTYDVDLMWHSHQLHAAAYCNDMTKLIGKVLEHDDTDSDRSKGSKLDVGFSETTKQYEDTFAFRYWKAGAMNRGRLPTPLMGIPSTYEDEGRGEFAFRRFHKNLPLPEISIFEVLLEIVDVKNLPADVEKENIYVSFAKKRPDMFLRGNGTLSILSVTGKKNVAGFECEPNGDILLTLLARQPSGGKAAIVIGNTLLSLDELAGPDSRLSVEKWLELTNQNGKFSSGHISIRVAFSCTTPNRAPYEFDMIQANSVSWKTCFLPITPKDDPKSWTSLVDLHGAEIIRVQMREKKLKNSIVFRRDIVGVTKISPKPFLLAENLGDNWLFTEYPFMIPNEIKPNSDGCLLEFQGNQLIKLFWGKRLDYEPKCCGRHVHDPAITAVEFCSEYPYGKAIAFLNLETKLIKVKEEWFVLPWIVMAFIFIGMFSKHGQNRREAEAPAAA